MKRYNDTPTEVTVIDLDEGDLDAITVDGKLLSGKLLPILENLTYAATLTKSFEADFVEEVKLQKESPEELKLISSKTSSNNFKRIKRYLKYHPNDIEFIVELYKCAPSIARDKTISWHEKCFLMKAFRGMNVSVTRCFDKALYPVLQKCKTIGQARAAIAIWDETNIFNKSSVMETLLVNKHMTKILDNMYNMNVKTMQKKAEYAYRQICRGKINDLHNSITNFFSRSEGNFDIDKYSFDDDMLSKTVSFNFHLESLSAETKMAIEDLLINNDNTEDAKKLIKLALEICHTSTGGIDEFDDGKLAKILKNNFLLNSIKHVKDTQGFNELFSGYETVNRFCKSKKYVRYKADVIKLIKSLKGKQKEIIKMFNLCQSPQNIQLILKIYHSVGDKINFDNLTLEKLSAVEDVFDLIQQSVSNKQEQNNLIKYSLEFVNEKDVTPEDIQKLQVLSIHKDKDLLNPLDQKYSAMPKREVVNMLYQHFLHLNKNGIYENDVAERRFDTGKLEKDELQAVLKKYRTNFIEKSQVAQMKLLSKDGLSKDVRKYIVDNPSFASAVLNTKVFGNEDPGVDEIVDAYNYHKEIIKNVDVFFSDKEKKNDGQDDLLKNFEEIFDMKNKTEEEKGNIVFKVNNLLIPIALNLNELKTMKQSIALAHKLADDFNANIGALNLNLDFDLIAETLIKNHSVFVVNLLTGGYGSADNLSQKLKEEAFRSAYQKLLSTISEKLPPNLLDRIKQKMSKYKTEDVQVDENEKQKLNEPHKFSLVREEGDKVITKEYEYTLDDDEKDLVLKVAELSYRD